MNISSTPFIRNDYWPDYNDINVLNQKINEVENELSLTNIRLSADIENVSNNLNTYANDQANTTIANNIIVNNINANYAVGKFVNFGNANFDNTYIENLTVNKPVFDITLNTPHIENATSLGGNFYDLNLNNASVTNLYVNIATAPIQSSAVLGYDPQGKVIPVEAVYDVGFPESANYLYTDEFGTAFGGVAATEVSAVDNLITAQAVQNSYNDINSTFNDVNNFVNDSYNDINNTFNDTNNFVNDCYNDINNTFNDTNNFVNDCYNDINNTFNDTNNYVYNTFNEVNNTVNEIDILLRSLVGLSTSDAKYYTIHSGSTNNAGLDNTFTYIAFTTPADTTGYNVSLDSKNTVYAKVVGDTLIYSSDLLITNDFMNRVFNTNMANTFNRCKSLNQNILIPNSVTIMSSTFSGCTSLNQNIGIPNSVTTMIGTFEGCSSLDQNILIPNSVTNIRSIFGSLLSGCTNLNQNILIPNSVTDMGLAFSLCESLNQNILIPNSVTIMISSFKSCTNLNQNILIPNSVTNMSGTFNSCTNLNQNILIPNSVTDMSFIFRSCTSLNQDEMYIYSQNVADLNKAYIGVQHIGNIHIPTSVPKDTSNYMYNCLVNGNTGYTFASENVINDLPVDIEQWPPV